MPNRPEQGFGCLFRSISFVHRVLTGRVIPEDVRKDRWSIRV
jgi:hypothetical protein